jgi:hypothetical protein
LTDLDAFRCQDGTGGESGRSIQAAETGLVGAEHKVASAPRWVGHAALTGRPARRLPPPAAWGCPGSSWIISIAGRHSCAELRRGQRRGGR